MQSHSYFTFPESISSRCAADAALTKADVAAAIDFAASKITSSKFHGPSGASCTQIIHYVINILKKVEHFILLNGLGVITKKKHILLDV